METHTYQSVTQQLFNKIDAKINQLFPISIHRRQKRGLINFLGSAVKTITGNLDNEDGKRYEELIEKLQNQENKEKILLDEQISLTTQAIEKFNTSITKLTTNQNIFKARITEIEKVINKTLFTKIEVYPLLHLHTVFFQIITISQEMLRILEELETAITFAKLNTLHNSIIEPEDFLHELKRIQGTLKEQILPYKPDEQDILIYEKLIQVKAYQKDKRITFILEIPLTDHQVYNFYHLFSFPISHNSETFQIIIPTHKYLYLNEHYYSLTETECQEIIPGEYLCSLPEIHQVTTSAPCEVQLLRFTKAYEKCEILNVHLENTKIQKIQKNQWIGIFPREQPAYSICNEEKENFAVLGSYILTIPDGCKLKINQTTLQTYQNPDFQTKTVQAPKLQIPLNIQQKEEIFHQEPLHLESINLDELNPIYNKMQKLQQDLRKTENVPISFSTSIWTILIYICLFVIALYFIWRRCIQPKWSPSKESTQSTAATSQPMQEVPMKNLSPFGVPKFPI